jgi:hypothetical protein
MAVNAPVGAPIDEQPAWPEVLRHLIVGLLQRGEGQT